MHRLTATDTPMVRYTRTIFPSYAVGISHVTDIVTGYFDFHFLKQIKFEYSMVAEPPNP